MMGGSGAENEAEQEQRNIPRLPLFNTPPMVMHSPERPGMITPPLYTSASVPFGWEEEPGKPRPYASLVSFTTPSKCLELPPRLLLLDADDDDDANKLRKWSRLPSPNTVLEGPYVCSNSHQSPSFRILSKGAGIKEKRWFGSWRGKSIKVRREVSWGNDVFPSSAADRDTDDDDDVGVNGVGHKKVRTTKMKSSGSFYNLFQANFLVTINKGLKQVVPWRSVKLKKDGCGSLRL